MCVCAVRIERGERKRIDRARRGCILTVGCWEVRERGRVPFFR